MTDELIRITGLKAVIDDEGHASGWLAPFGGPVKGGRDLDGEFFSSDTNFGLDYYPTVPILYAHGQDPDVGPTKVGEITTKEIRDQGLWVEGQLDKQGQYYAALRELAEKGQIYWSSGSLTHLVTKNRRTGAIKSWPVAEATLTLTPANPWAEASIKGWLPEGTTQGDLDDGDFAWVADDKSLPDSERRKLPYKIHGTVNEEGWTAAWDRAHQDGTDFSGGPSQSEVIAKLLRDKPDGIDVDGDNDGKEANLEALVSFTAADVTAAKAGRRNSANDANALLQAHDHLASVLSLDCAPEMGKDAPAAPRLVITGTAAATDEPDLTEVREAMKAFAISRAKELLRTS